MSSIPIETDRGNLTMIFDSSTLNWLTVLKMVSCVLILLQARGALNIFSPILKNYRDVESGAAQGIPMNDRKVPKMKAHLKLVKRLTCAHIIVCFICILATRGMIKDISDQMIDQYYELGANQTTSVTAGGDSMDWDKLSEPMEKNLDEDQAQLNPFAPEEETNENFGF